MVINVIVIAAVIQDIKIVAATDVARCQIHVIYLQECIMHATTMMVILVNGGGTILFDETYLKSCRTVRG